MKPKVPLFIFVLNVLLSPFVSGQNPGGVKGYEYWFSAEESKDTAEFKEAEGLLNYRTTRKIDYKNKFENISSRKTSGDATVFIVMKPAFQQARSAVADIVSADRKISIQSDRISSKEELRIQNFASEKPFLISYTESVQPDTARMKSEKISGNADRFEGEIAEIIFYPRFLSGLKRRKVETYLALKHGISLAPGADYINSAGDTIWKGNENEIFPNRLTGIGWDMGGNFNNSQSSNVDDYQFLTIGFGNQIRAKNLKKEDIRPDPDYLLWSDNDGAIEFETTEETTGFPLLLNRAWFAKKTGTSIADETVTFRFDLNLMPEENTDSGQEDEKTNDLRYWLISASGNLKTLNPQQADFIETAYPSENDRKLVFSGIPLSRFDDTFLFTLAKAPEMFALTGQDNNACQTELNLKIIGGTAPYVVLLFGDDNRKFNPEKINEKEFIFSNLKQGRYIYQITDASGKISEEEISIAFSPEELIELPDLFLQKGQSETINLDKYTDSGQYEISWLKDNSDFGSGYQNKISGSGDYKVIFHAGNGCSFAASFKVFELPGQDWTGIYPNPVRANEDFFIKLTDDTPSVKKITITDQTGRTVKTKTVQSGTGIYAGRFQSTGIYTVSIESQNKKQQYTIIIK